MLCEELLKYRISKSEFIVNKYTEKSEFCGKKKQWDAQLRKVSLILHLAIFQ